MDAAPERAFRDVLGRFATGVTIMTTATPGGIHGMTANAVSSVSLDPPLVLVCVDITTVMVDLLEKSGVFALSMLHRGQEHLSRHFADPWRPMGAAQFHGLAFHEVASGSPVLDDTLAYLDCRVWATYPGGDHTIFVGEVLALGLGQDADPLLFYGGEYRAATLDEP